MSKSEIESKHLSHLFADRQSLSHELDLVTPNEDFVTRLITAMHASLVRLAEEQDERKQAIAREAYERNKAK